MRIAILIGRFPPHDVGGAERQADRLAAALAARGHAVTVITRRWPGRAARERRDAFDIVRTPIAFVGGARTALDAAATLGVIARMRPRPDVVLAFQSFASGWIAGLADALWSIPSVVWVRGENEYRFDRLPHLFPFSKFAWKQARRVLVQSDAHRRALLAHIAERNPFLAERLAPRVEVLGNGVDVPATSAPEGSDWLYVGRLIAHKGLDVLLEALVRLSGTPGDRPLWIVGDGPDRAALEARARTLGLDARFEGMRSRDELPSYYARARAIVLPSTQGEGLPNALLEAMAAGVPPVATAIAGVSELVEGVGPLAPPGDVAALARALLTLCDADERRRASAAARARASTCGFDEIAARLEAVLERAAAPAPRIRLIGADAGAGGAMSFATEARRVLETLPPGTRETLESAVSFVPRTWLYGRTFRATRGMLKHGEFRPASELQAEQDERVRNLVAWCYERVPYYGRVMRERGVRPEHVRGARDLALLPTLDKEGVRRHEEELLARGVPARARDMVATGGSSGVPLRLWIDRNRSAVEWAFMTWQWGRVGYRPGARRAVLRGAEVRSAGEGRFHEWHPLLDELVLSTFRLSADTLPAYLALFERYRPEFLHAYPSSAETLARLLRDVAPERRPRFRALLLGSENLYPAQRTLLERTFGVPVFSWYGHSEKCLLGGGCERSGDYHLFPEYGVLEVVDDQGDPVGPGGTGTIVGTGFLNRVMPFVRYRTDDRGTLAEGACACGRAYPRLASIEGRGRTSERLIGLRGEVISMAAINTHSDAFDQVLRFRIVQDHPGEATVEVVPRPGFGDADRAAIATEYSRRAAGVVAFEVRLVDTLPLTERGKFKMIEQRIPERRDEVA